MASTDSNGGSPVFESILFPGPEAAVVPADTVPASFTDLNLDQVVDAIVAGRDEYDLRPFFNGPLLRDADAIGYRHEVFRDLEGAAARTAVAEFAERMRNVRRYLDLAKKQHYRYEKERWFLDAAAIYCDAVTGLLSALDEAGPTSRGLKGLREHLVSYARSDGFSTLAGDVREVLTGLESVRYTLQLRGSRVTVSTYDDEPDYTAEVEETFRRFRQGAVDEHELKIADPGTMDHVEARISELVARIFRREFGALDRFCTRHASFVEPTLVRFDREVQLYLACLEHVERLEHGGIAFCYPEVSSGSTETHVEGAFDLALAAKLAADRERVVANDFALAGPERVLVVTGPNQGGKTTFARAFGQLHHLAGLGLPVPAARAQVFLPDAVYTHFERAEDMTTLRGKLDDELVRMREILDRATSNSIVVVNEMFASTTLDDAVLLGTEVLRQLVDRGCLTVCVTFVDELSSLGAETVSMVAAVDSRDPSTRTFRIERRPADGRAYAWAIAEKYGLSHETLLERLRS